VLADAPKAMCIYSAAFPQFVVLRSRSSFKLHTQSYLIVIRNIISLITACFQPVVWLNYQCMLTGH